MMLITSGIFKKWEGHVTSPNEEEVQCNLGIYWMGNEAATHASVKHNNYITI